MSLPAAQQTRSVALLDAYADHCRTVGLSPATVRMRLAAAGRFLAGHPDLPSWMRRPLQARLTDLDRMRAWPLVAFAILSGRVRADFDLLAAKHAGRSFAPTLGALFRDEVTTLHAAAQRLDWAPSWTADVLREALPIAVAASGHPPSALTEADVDAVRAAVTTSPYYTASMRRSQLSHLHSLARLLYEARIINTPPVHRRGEGPGNLDSRLAVVAAPQIRRVLLGYLTAKQAVVKVSSIRNLASHLAAFGEFLSDRYPDLTRLTDLRREHIEAYCAFVPTRHWRGQRVCDNRIGSHSVIAELVALRGFLDDITAWGWAEAPTRRLMFATDVPRPPRELPRALAPDVDAALMHAVPDARRSVRPHRPARAARGGSAHRRAARSRAGLRHRVRAGRVLAASPARQAQQRTQRTAGHRDADRDRRVDRPPRQPARLPHPRDGRMVDFLFVERGRRPSAARIQRGLADAVRTAGLHGPDGAALHVTPHQLRHCYATALANSGMSMQALMALLGHTTPEMTLRYATLALPTLRSAYDTAMGRMRPRLPIAPVGKPLLPDRVEWLHAEMLKTRLAHGYCARKLAADTCPYANICETCENFPTGEEFAPALHAQLADVRALRDDAAPATTESSRACRRTPGDSPSEHDPSPPT